MTLLTLTKLLVTRVNGKTRQYTPGSTKFSGVRWTLNIGMAVRHPALVHVDQGERAIREQSHHPHARPSTNIRTPPPRVQCTKSLTYRIVPDEPKVCNSM
jgi:hypothetical protein